MSLLNQYLHVGKIPKRLIHTLGFEKHCTRENGAPDSLSLGEAEGKHRHKHTALRQRGPPEKTPILVWTTHTLASVFCHFIPPPHPFIHPSRGSRAYDLHSPLVKVSLTACYLTKMIIWLSFFIYFIDVMNHIYWFSYVKPPLHPRGKTHLIIVYEPFNVTVVFTLLVFCWEFLYLHPSRILTCNCLFL